MNRPPKTRFGIVGAGAIAQAYGQAFAKTEGAELAAVADCRRAAAEAMAATHGCLAFDSLETMVRQASIEAAIVCTPPSTHPEVCERLFELGVHVLCEKPLAINRTAAMQMIEAAQQRNVLFTMASKFRYAEDVARAQVLVASGIVGEVVLFENVFTGRVDMSRRWNSDPAISGGGVLIDNGTHSVDIARFFLGAIADVQAIEGNRIQVLPVEDTAKMFVRSDAGVLGSIDLSWSVSKELPYYIAVYGSQGTLLVGWRESKYRRVEDKEWTLFGAGYDKLAAFAAQIANFTAAIAGTEELRVTPEDGLASVHAIEAAYRSLARGVWEPIEDLVSV